MGRDKMAAGKASVPRCSACGGGPQGGPERTFAGVPVCQGCFDKLRLSDLENDRSRGPLWELTEEAGRGALGDFLALVKAQDRASGWKMLSTVPEAVKLKENAGRQLLTGSLIICGTSLVKEGRPDGPPQEDQSVFTLMIMIGEVLTLSMLRRIVRDQSLSSKSPLDESILGAELRSCLYSMLKDLKSDADGSTEKVLANAIWTLCA